MGARGPRQRPGASLRVGSKMNDMEMSAKYVQLPGPQRPKSTGFRASCIFSLIDSRTPGAWGKRTWRVAEGGRPLPAQRGGDPAVPGLRGGRASGGAGGRRRGSCRSPPARLPPGRQTLPLLKLRGGRPPTARGGCVRLRAQLQAPARPPGERPVEPARVGASVGPTTRGTCAPCTASTLLAPRQPRLHPRHPALPHIHSALPTSRH